MKNKLEAIAPGTILLEEFMEPRGIGIAQMAKDLDIPTSLIVNILNGKERIYVGVATSLGQYFGNSSEFWLNLQREYDSRKSGERMMGIGLFNTADKERLKKLHQKKIDLLKKYYDFKEHEHVLLELIEELKELDYIRLDVVVNTDINLKCIDSVMAKLESEIEVDVDFKSHLQIVNSYRYTYYYSDDRSYLMCFDTTASNLHEAGLKFAKFAKEEAIKAGKHGVVVDRVDCVERQNLEM